MFEVESMATGLVLLHGFPLDSTMWEPQVSALSEHITVLAPNFPGLGEAPAVGDVTTMDAAADYAAQQMRVSNLEKAVICGISMGGYAALALWRRHPELVDGLVLANTRAGGDDDAGKQRRRDLAERLRAEGNAFLAESPPPLFSEKAAPQLWDRVKEIIRAQPAEGLAAASVGMAERADSNPDLAKITVPVLVITAMNDTLIPPEASKDMAGRIPNARYEVIENAGHLSNMEAPGEFNRLLSEFIRHFE
jgi:3-oxoadipate enol-lactonase